MAPNDDNPEEVKKAEIKYLWLGYGGYAGPSDSGAFNSLNIRADVSIFDKLMKIFRGKDKKTVKPDDEQK